MTSVTRTGNTGKTREVHKKSRNKTEILQNYENKILNQTKIKDEVEDVLYN